MFPFSESNISVLCKKNWYETHTALASINVCNKELTELEPVVAAVRFLI